MLHHVSSAHALAVVRIVVYGIWLLTLVLYPFERYAELHFDWFKPYGPARFVPAAFWQLLLEPAVLFAIRIALIGLSALLILGARPFRSLALVFAILITLVDAIVRGLNGAVTHSELAVLYAAWVFVFFPGADALSILGRRWSAPALYRAPMLLITLAMATGYMLIGTRRLAAGGFEIFAGEAILRYMSVQSLNYSSWSYTLGLLPLTSALLAFGAKAGFLITTLVEITAPVAVLHAAYRRIWLIVMIPFHIMVLLTMNIFFWQNLLLIVFLFTDLPHRLGERLSAPRIVGSSRRASSAVAT